MRSTQTHSPDFAVCRADAPLLIVLLLVLGALPVGYAVGGHLGLTSAAVGGLILLSTFLAWRIRLGTTSPNSTLLDRAILADRAEAILSDGRRCLGTFAFEIDGYRSLCERFEYAKLQILLDQSAQRVATLLGETDVAARVDGPCFLLVTAPNIPIDLSTGLQLASQIQTVLSEPYDLDGTTVTVTLSVGFSLSNRIENPDVEKLFLAATTALVEAQRSGPSAIRSYSAIMERRIVARRYLVNDVRAALGNGQISAYFQPQISTETGDITGFESLARWHHPVRGAVPPNEFIPAFQDAGAMTDLMQHMLRESLAAINLWDDACVHIPRVGVNLSSAELSDPGLVPLIVDTLDEYHLSPERLSVEVLETVVANRVRGIVVDNLAQLAKLGCGVDLDDFGTGHASITSIRRFSIERIKIDRSFVTGIDDDPEQQAMVTAILTMAERLGLDALAEGVETQSEEVTLARLGCAHVQGFGIAHPMPLNDTVQWIESYQSRRAQPEAVAFPRQVI